MLELLVKGLLLWFYDLILQCVGFVGNVLLEVFSMDTAYFTSHAPVVAELQKLFIGVGWALLLGNLAFQAMRSMMAGIGVDAEDPKLLFAKSFLFAFLLMASPQICRVGLDLTSGIVSLMQVPDAVTIMAPEESWFDFSGGWILAILAGIILVFQVFRLFFEIGERYVVLNTLVFFAPLAFAMGGSKSTEDIFKGWARMFGSMCVVMVSNVFFLKVILSALSTVPNSLTVIPWLIFVVGLCKVARRFDDILCRIGLNAAHTGKEHVIPGALTAMVLRSAVQTVHKASQQAYGGRAHGSGGFHGFGGFKDFGSSGNNWRWGGAFGAPPQLPQASLPAGNSRPGLPGDIPPAGLSGGPSPRPDAPLGPNGNPRASDSDNIKGTGRSVFSRSGTAGTGTQRPPSGGAKRPYPLAHGNIDIFEDDDEPQRRPPFSRSAAPAAPTKDGGKDSNARNRPATSTSAPTKRPLNTAERSTVAHHDPRTDGRQSPGEKGAAARPATTAAESQSCPWAAQTDFSSRSVRTASMHMQQDTSSSHVSRQVQRQGEILSPPQALQGAPGAHRPPLARTNPAVSPTQVLNSTVTPDAARKNTAKDIEQRARPAPRPQADKTPERPAGQRVKQAPKVRPQSDKKSKGGRPPHGKPGK